MTCQYLKDARCSLAESLAMQELSIVVECHAGDACAKCLKSGEPSPERPSIACIGLVTPLVPPEQRMTWTRAVAWLVNGKSRGLGDTVAKITRATRIDKGVKTLAKAFGANCGCPGRQKKLNQVFPSS